jgi:tetratricopeptide (TPR) repeat protein
MLRQLIFKGKTSQAFIMAGSAMSTAYWAGAARDAGLWKVRLAVFKNDLACALSQIDSAKIDPNWQYAAQMLEHKYACNLFAAQPELFGAWGMLSLSLYSGHPEYAADTIASLGLTGSIRELVLATLCEALLDAGMQEKCAAILLPAIQESPDARILFIYAEACAMQGKYDEAGKILNKLILEYPDDIFSDRARMYLSGFNDKIKMHE